MTNGESGDGRVSLRNETCVDRFIDSIQTQKIRSVNGAIAAPVDLFDVEASGLDMRQGHDQKIVAVAQQSGAGSMPKLHIKGRGLYVEMIAMDTQQQAI